MAATQGIYSRVNTRKLTAARGVKSRDSTGTSMDGSPTFISTARVLTTVSLAISPVTRAVAARQSPKPSGAKNGAITWPIAARMLSELSVTMEKCVLKF